MFLIGHSLFLGARSVPLTISGLAGLVAIKSAGENNFLTLGGVCGCVNDVCKPLTWEKASLRHPRNS